MKKILAAALLCTVAVPAFAADLPSMKAAPALPAIDSFDPWLIRVRGLAVLPDASGTKLLGNTWNSAALSDNGIPEVDFTYFFTKNIAAELIAGVSHHRLTAPATATALGLNPNVAFANTTLLPPTLTLQYHFALGQLDPYVGVGINYTWFLGTRSPILNNSVNIHSAVAPAFQFGADYYLTKNWLINVDAKYILLETDANIGNSGVPGVTGVNAVNVKVNPWIVGAGIGYRFSLPSAPAAVVAKY